jgi:hypothetical protein
LKYKMNEAHCRINKDAATIKHLRVRHLSHRSEKMAGPWFHIQSG